MATDGVTFTVAARQGCPWDAAGAIAPSSGGRVLTLRDVVWPALDCLVREFSLAGPRVFWQLFELLTRESLTLPITGGGPRFSGINSDGTPWQFCVPLGAAVTGGVRYLTEIGVPGTTMSARVRLARRRLDDVMDLLQLPAETAGVVDALFGLLPQLADRLDALRGGVWVGVGAGADGQCGIRLYANNEWGDELARWQRLTTALRRLGAGGFGRLLRDHVADLVQSFSPVGLAASLGRKTILKLYLRPRANPWEACTRLMQQPVFGLPINLPQIEHAMGVRLSTLTERALVLSIAGSSDGQEPDLKIDLNGQWLFDMQRTPEKTVESLATTFGIDPRPYRLALSILQGAAAPGFVPVHDFIGFGGGAHGLRLNVYLRLAAS